ncbi:MAG: GNAT family N-acetyltransferase, partial [Aquaticitalea sp.]
GMAVLKEYQKHGFGDAILNYGEQLLKQENTELIWFNARTIATGFYQKNDYKIIGEPFEIIGVGTHYIMYKRL